MLQDREDLFKVIDQEALDERESKESKAIYDALMSNKSRLSAAADLPEDPRLNRQIHQEAERRSREVTVRSSTVALAAARHGKPIPRWLWILWLVAIVAAGVAWVVAGYLLD